MTVVQWPAEGIHAVAFSRPRKRARAMAAPQSLAEGTRTTPPNQSPPKATRTTTATRPRERRAES